MNSSVNLFSAVVRSPRTAYSTSSFIFRKDAVWTDMYVRRTWASIGRIVRIVAHSTTVKPPPLR